VCEHKHFRGSSGPRFLFFCLFSRLFPALLPFFQLCCLVLCCGSLAQCLYAVCEVPLHPQNPPHLPLPVCLSPPVPPSYSFFLLFAAPTPFFHLLGCFSPSQSHRSPPLPAWGSLLVLFKLSMSPACGCTHTRAVKRRIWGGKSKASRARTKEKHKLRKDCKTINDCSRGGIHNKWGGRGEGTALYSGPPSCPPSALAAPKGQNRNELHCQAHTNTTQCLRRRGQDTCLEPTPAPETNGTTTNQPNDTQPAAASNKNLPHAHAHTP
jgi:hypothetical protein